SMSSCTSFETFAFSPASAPHTSNSESTFGNSFCNLRTTSQTGSVAEATPKRICTLPVYCCLNQLRRHSSVASSQPLSGFKIETEGEYDRLRGRRCSGKRRATTHCQTVKIRLSIASEAKSSFDSTALC